MAWKAAWYPFFRTTKQKSPRKWDTKLTCKSNQAFRNTISVVDKKSNNYGWFKTGFMDKCPQTQWVRFIPSSCVANPTPATQLTRVNSYLLCITHVFLLSACKPCLSTIYSTLAWSVITNLVILRIHKYCHTQPNTFR